MQNKTIADCFAEMIGVPHKPEGESDAAYRSRIMSKLKIEPYTRERLKNDVQAIRNSIPVGTLFYFHHTSPKMWHTPRAWWARRWESKVRRFALWLLKKCGLEEY